MRYKTVNYSGPRLNGTIGRLEANVSSHLIDHSLGHKDSTAKGTEHHAKREQNGQKQHPL